MPREVDQKKTRKALRKLRKAKVRAEAEGIDLSDWEKEFVEGVDERLNKYGSAFSDYSLGAPGEPLSAAQAEILRQLDRKSRGKTSGGFKTRKPLTAKKSFGRTPMVETDTPEMDEPEAEVPRAQGPPHFRVIQGGKP